MFKVAEPSEQQTTLAKILAEQLVECTTTWYKISNMFSKLNDRLFTFVSSVEK